MKTDPGLAKYVGTLYLSIYKEKKGHKNEISKLSCPTALKKKCIFSAKQQRRLGFCN